MSEFKTTLDQIKSADLDVITHRLIIDVVLELASQMHIGIGGDDVGFTPDSSILRSKMDGLPYIPSSTIKGNFRSAVESLAMAINEKDAEKEYVCKHYPDSYCTVEIEENKYKEPCVVCSIFGGMDLAAHIIFSDAFLTEETINMIESGLKPGIAIDRDKQVSRDKSLFFIETLHPGAQFRFQMIINNISANEKKKQFDLLRSLFQMINLDLISFGGKKSTGMGQFRLKDVKVKELKNKEAFLFPDEVQSIDFQTYFNLKPMKSE